MHGLEQRAKKPPQSVKNHSFIHHPPLPALKGSHRCALIRPSHLHWKRRESHHQLQILHEAPERHASSQAVSKYPELDLHHHSSAYLTAIWNDGRSGVPQRPPHYRLNALGTTDTPLSFARYPDLRFHYLLSAGPHRCGQCRQGHVAGGPTKPRSSQAIP